MSSFFLVGGSSSRFAEDFFLCRQVFDVVSSIVHCFFEKEEENDESDGVEDSAPV